MTSEMLEHGSSPDAELLIQASMEEVTQIEIKTAGSNIPILENYSIRDDDEITSSDEENAEHHNSSLRSWFSRSRHHRDSGVSENSIKIEPASTTESAIAEGTPQRHGSSSPQKRSFRSFFRRDSTHEEERHLELQVCSQEKPVGAEGEKRMKSADGEEVQEEPQLPETPTSSKFWKPWRGHHHRHRHSVEAETPLGMGENLGVETLRIPSTDAADMISHEEKRQKNMVKLADQLEAVSPGSSPDREVCDMDEMMTPERGDTEERSIESGSTSSSIERAQVMKERVGLVFSASPGDSCDGKIDEISPLTPPGDVVENPYNYVFEPAKQKVITPLAQDSTMIDSSSAAYKNFECALKLMTKDSKSLSNQGGRSSVPISEISSQFLGFIEHLVQCQEHLVQEKGILSSDLQSSKDEAGTLRDDCNLKDAEKMNLQKQLDDVNEKVKSTVVELDALKEKSQKTDEDRQRLEKALEDAERALQPLEAELCDLKNQLQKKDQEKLGLEKEVEEANEKINRMDRDLEEATDEIDMLSGEVESYKGEIQEAKTSERMAIERAEKDIAKAKKETESELKRNDDILKENSTLKSKVEDLQKEYKNIVFDHEMLQEKHSITTTRLADLVGTFSKEHDSEREMRDSIEATGNKLRRYENTIEILKIGNLKIQENFHRERRKVLDLRQENNLYQKQLQYIECHRSQSLQFMSHLMFYYRNIVTDETLAQFDFYLKRLNESDFCPSIIRMKDDELKECFKERENLVVKFYTEIAKQMFLDQVVAKHVSYMRSNNFLSSQLVGLRKQIDEYEQYVSRLLKEIQAQKNSQVKNKQKTHHQKEKIAECKPKLSQITN